MAAEESLGKQFDNHLARRVPSDVGVSFIPGEGLVAAVYPESPRGSWDDKEFVMGMHNYWKGIVKFHEARLANPHHPPHRREKTISDRDFAQSEVDAIQNMLNRDHPESS